MIKKDGFEKVGDSTTSNILDVNELTDGGVYTKIAYVHNSTTGWQRNDKGFITFYLKDINGNIIEARLFSVEDFLFSGVKSSSLKKHFVTIQFQAQIFNGSWSLILKSIELTELQNVAELLPRFIGKIEVDDSRLNNFSMEFINQNLPSCYSNTSLDSIADGRLNGYVKMLDIALPSIIGAVDLPGIKESELFSVFFYTAKYYFQLLNHRQELSGFEDFEDYSIFSEIKMSLSDTNYYMLIIDALQSLSSNYEPKSLVSYIVAHSIKVAIFILNASYKLQNVPYGTKTHIGGSTLLRF